MTDTQIRNAFARLLAIGYTSSAVSTREIMEEIKFLARLTGKDGTQFLTDCIFKRDSLLAESGVFQKR